MGTMASQITSLTIVYSTVYSGADQRKHQSTAPLAFVLGTGEFPAQMASNTENVSIWWRHHGKPVRLVMGEGVFVRLGSDWCFTSTIETGAHRDILYLH